MFGARSLESLRCSCAAEPAACARAALCTYWRARCKQSHSLAKLSGWFFLVSAADYTPTAVDQHGITNHFFSLTDTAASASAILLQHRAVDKGQTCQAGGRQRRNIPFTICLHKEMSYASNVVRCHSCPLQTCLVVRVCVWWMVSLNLFSGDTYSLCLCVLIW